MVRQRKAYRHNLVLSLKRSWVETIGVSVSRSRQSRNSSRDKVPKKNLGLSKKAPLVQSFEISSFQIFMDQMYQEFTTKRRKNKKFRKFVVNALKAMGQCLQLG